MLIYYLPEGYNHQSLEQALSGQFGYIPEARKDHGVTIYDTFDWRLFEKDLALILEESQLQLVNLSSGARLQNQSVTGGPDFAWNLPTGEIRRILEPIVEMRAFLNRGEAQKTSICYRILNRDEKTVARLVFVDMVFTGAGQLTDPLAYVALSGVRGYPRYLQALEKFCQNAGFALSSTKDLYRRLFEAGGSSPGDYSPKLDFRLMPEMRSDEATVVILKFLLGIMRRNEQGIREDIDTEYLHDFRVAVRRTRSALREIRGVFPPEVTNRFNNDFSRIGKFTNHLRDLDVYLLNEDLYRAMLPDILQEYLTPLFTYLRGKRSDALQEVIDGLDSPDYVNSLHDWETFLSQPLPDNPASSDASHPVLDLANRSIYKRYRSLVRNGKKILNHVEEDRLHALRIECKKLRYLMEFFTSLYPPAKVAVLIKQLKVLQDNLGDFNDLSIQGGYLLEIAGELPVDDANARHALVAIGSLVEALNERKKTVQNKFAEIFTQFATSQNKRLFQELFKGTRKNGTGVPS